MIKQFEGEYRFLSNFWQFKNPIVVFYHEWYDTETPYQLSKCPYELSKFLKCETPMCAKRLGKKVQKRSDWDLVKREIMHELVFAKFKNNPDLKRRLIETGNQIIQEGNTWNDTYWGINLITGEGQNHLGKILMDVRRKLS